MTRYIDQHRDRFGVEPTCRSLQVAPSSYYAARSRQPSARASSDAELGPKVLKVFNDNYRVYGARKLWRQLQREGVVVGRDRVARLMRSLGIAGAVRGKTRRTTIADPAATRAPDLVQRRFVASRPNQLWVSDFTYVASWSGTVYVAVVIDVFSRLIVGWRAVTTMRTELVLDALEMAIWRRASVLDGLICHSDAGRQGGFNWSSQHLGRGGVDGDDARAAAGGAVVPGADPLAGSADGGLAAGPRAVLGGDRAGCPLRRCGDADRGITGGRDTVVPARWRGEPLSCPDGGGSLLVLRRTRGHRHLARTEAWCARDRPAAEPVAVDDLA
jgi:putative transposase